MSAYMIFTEVAEQSRTAQITEKLGIGQIEFQENHLTWLPVPCGPGGKSGWLGFWLDESDAGLRGYEPDKQKWVAEPGAKFWVGTHLLAPGSTGRPLLPSDILRSRPHANSLPTVLEDGNAWLIPVAKSLPHLWGEDAAGNFVRVPADEYQEFCREAEAVFEQVTNYTGDGDLKLSSQWGYVCRALALNYRLAPPIISALRLIGDRSGARVLGATIELQLIADVEEEKKNTAAASTAAG